MEKCRGKWSQDFNREGYGTNKCTSSSHPTRLSDIEPGGGTNFNEALHRHINPHFNHAGRMGLPLAYALLTILLYIHNCKKESPRDVLGELIAVKLRVSNTESTVVPFGRDEGRIRGRKSTRKG